VPLSVTGLHCRTEWEERTTTAGDFRECHTQYRKTKSEEKSGACCSSTVALLSHFVLTKYCVEFLPAIAEIATLHGSSGERLLFS
jgi:hypothetical protein